MNVENIVSHTTTIPAVSSRYAEITKIGGMSYRSKNLFGCYGSSIHPVHPDHTVVTVDGSHVFVHMPNSLEYWFGYDTMRPYTTQYLPAGTYRLSWHNLEISPINGYAVIAGTYSLDSDDTETLLCERNVKNNTGYTFTLSKASKIYTSIYFVNNSGEDLDAEFDFMLTPVSSDAEFEPYFAGLRSSAIREIRSECKNLIAPNDSYYAGRSVTMAGVTFTVNDDLSIHIKGSSTNVGDSWFTFTQWETFAIDCAAGVYTVSQKVDGIVTNTDGRLTVEGNFINSDGTEINRDISHYTVGSENKVVTTNQPSRFIGSIYVTPGIELDCTVYLQLEKGTTATPYTPYREPSVLPIPDVIQALEGYGQGVSEEYCNYIDWRPDEGVKQFVQNTYRLVLDGTENWVISDTAESEVYRLYTEIPYPSSNANDSITIAPAICDRYSIESTGRTWYCYRGVSLDSSSMFIYDDSYNKLSSVSDWKSYLAEQYAAGTPVTIEYALAEPIITDLSDVLDNRNFIEVETGGSLIAVNEQGFAIPMTIEYPISKKGVVDDKVFIDIGYSIRSKNDSVDRYSPNEMSKAIKSITTGIIPSGSKEITQNGTYNVSEYEQAVVAVPATGIEPSGTVKITLKGTHRVYSYEYAQVEDSDLVPENIKSGVDILGVTGTYKATYNPSGTMKLTTTELYLCEEWQYAQIEDEDLVPENIKSGVDILGVTGTYVGTNTSPSGTKTITENGEYDVTDYAKALVNVPDKGITPSGLLYISSTDTVDVTQYAEAKVSDYDLSPENIKDGVDILGVAGTYKPVSTTYITITVYGWDEFSATYCAFDGSSISKVVNTQVSDRGNYKYEMIIENAVVGSLLWIDCQGLKSWSEVTSSGSVDYFGGGYCNDTPSTNDCFIFHVSSGYLTGDITLIVDPAYLPG